MMWPLHQHHLLLDLGPSQLHKIRESAYAAKDADLRPICVKSFPILAYKHFFFTEPRSVFKEGLKKSHKSNRLLPVLDVGEELQ